MLGQRGGGVLGWWRLRGRVGGIKGWWGSRAGGVKG